MAYSRLFILTGERGVGKSSLCRDLARLASQAGWQVRGILSPGVFEAGKKIGIGALDLRTGEQRRLAVRRQARQSGQAGLQTEQWQFDPIVTSWGNTVLQSSVPCDLLIVDELGPLEFERGQGWPAGLTALDSGLYHWGVVVVRPELLEAAHRRWNEAISVVVDSQTKGGEPGPCRRSVPG